MKINNINIQKNIYKQKIKENKIENNKKAETKISKIKKMIQNGEYKININNIANSMIGELTGFRKH